VRLTSSPGKYQVWVLVDDSVKEWVRQNDTFDSCLAAFWRALTLHLGWGDVVVATEVVRVEPPSGDQ